MMRLSLAVLTLFAFSVPVLAQTPTIFDVADVVVGAKRIPTRWLFAEGKWSDAGDKVSAVSTVIRCYKELGFCEVANADWDQTGAAVFLTEFDILRWDDSEIIAVDSSPICIVNTVRVDLAAKRITLSSVDKGISGNPFCKGTDKLQTAVLLSVKDVVRKEVESLGPKK